MNILGFILIVSGLLVATYFSGPKNTPQQDSQPSPPQGQVTALPINSTASDNKEPMVTIKNKTTGEIKQIPKSQVENYISTPSKQQSQNINPSDKSLKLSAYLFAASNEKQRSDLMSRFSNGTNDLKESVKNLALQLDSNPEATTLAEKLIAQDIANKKAWVQSISATIRSLVYSYVVNEKIYSYNHF